MRRTMLHMEVLCEGYWQVRSASPEEEKNQNLCPASFSQT